MTKPELAAECYQIIASLYYELEDKLEKTDGYVSASLKESFIRVMEGLSAISNEDEEPETLLPFEM